MSNDTLREELDALLFKRLKGILWGETDNEVKATLAMEDQHAFRAYREVALDLLATNRAQAEEIEKLKQEVIIAESGQDADLRHIQALREALAEIYALRGEDSTIARICNRHL